MMKKYRLIFVLFTFLCMQYQPLFGQEDSQFSIRFQVRTSRGFNASVYSIRLENHPQLIKVNNDGLTDWVRLNRGAYLNKFKRLEILRNGIPVDEFTVTIRGDLVTVVVQEHVYTLMAEIDTLRSIVDHLTKEYNADINQVVSAIDERKKILENRVEILEDSLSEYKEKAYNLQASLDEFNVSSEEFKQISEAYNQNQLEIASITSALIVAKKEVEKLDMRIRNLLAERNEFERSNRALLKTKNLLEETLNGKIDSLEIRLNHAEYLSQLENFRFELTRPRSFLYENGVIRFGLEPKIFRSIDYLDSIFTLDLQYELWGLNLKSNEVVFKVNSFDELEFRSLVDASYNYRGSDLFIEMGPFREFTSEEIIKHIKKKKTLVFMNIINTDSKYAPVVFSGNLRYSKGIYSIHDLSKNDP